MIKSKLLGVDPDEIVLHEIKRHPIGLYTIVTITGFLFALLIVALFVIVRNDTDLGLDNTMVSLVFIAVGLLIVIIGYIAATIYRTNELIVTNENLVQILQQSLFDRKISQLNLAKVQDVTVDQEGILPTVFGYGTIRVETAGEAANFIFHYSPNPNINAKHIVEAHEQYLRTHHLDSGQSPAFTQQVQTGV